MQLSKTAFLAKGYKQNLYAFSVRLFSAKEYDLAVIGGGPGGNDNLINKMYRLCCCY